MAEKVKPRWLILGGLGFVGRNLVKYLVDNGLASKVRIADKKAPFMAFLSGDYKAAIMENPVVECVQVDLSDDDMLAQAFAPDSGAGGGGTAAAAGGGASSPAWDFVINVAAETALGKKDEFYQKTVDAASKSGALAAAIGGVRKYVFVSTASVYKSDKGASKEDAKIAPWTAVAESLLRAEGALQTIAAGGPLPLVILRPSLIYGPGDFNGLMPRCVVAASYKKTGEKMELLWDGDMQLSTVHVFDVARAIVHAARKVEAGSIFNLADKGETDAGKVNAMLGAIFGIATGFMGSVKSNLANLKLDVVVDAANENHLGPWLSCLKEYGVKNTPLSPYLHKSLLAYNHLSVDGSAIEAAGFKYAVPAPTLELVRDPIAQHIAQGIFPPILAPAAAGAGT